MNAKRPTGLAALALVLWWLSIAGIAGAFVFSGGLLLRAISIAYGVTAFLAGVAIWQQRHWAARAFFAWSCIALASGVVFDVTLNLGPTLKGAAFLVIVGGFLWLVYRYVRARSAVGA